MVYQNQTYNTWNQEYFKEVAKQQHHNEQIRHCVECLDKLKDLMDTVDKVEPAYRSVLFQNMFGEIVAHNINQQKGDPYVHQYSR